MLRIAICDDEPTICEFIKEIVVENRLALSNNILCYYSGEDLYSSISKESFDLVFLDIELGRLNGVEIGKLIRDELQNEAVRIIYISGKQQYAMELFQVRPFDFLVKPLEQEKIVAVVKKVLQLSKNDKLMFQYKVKNEIFKIPQNEIIYLEANGRLVKMVTSDNIFYFYDKISIIEPKLNGFLRIHKSYLVNINNVTTFRYHELTVSNGQTLSISQSMRKRVRDSLLIFFKEG